MNKIEVGKTASPNLKAVKSKIGSMDNATYKPGGGKVKIESKKLDFSKTSSRISAKNEAYTPGGGEKKVNVSDTSSSFLFTNRNLESVLIIGFCPFLFFIFFIFGLFGRCSCSFEGSLACSLVCGRGRLAPGRLMS